MAGYSWVKPWSVGGRETRQPRIQCWIILTLFALCDLCYLSRSVKNVCDAWFFTINSDNVMKTRNVEVNRNNNCFPWNFFLEQYYDKGFPFLPSQKWKLLVFFRSRSPKKHNAWKFTSAPHKTWLTSWSHPKPQEWWRPLSDFLAHEVVIILMIPA